MDSLDRRENVRSYGRCGRWLCLALIFGIYLLAGCAPAPVETEPAQESVEPSEVQGGESPSPSAIPPSEAEESEAPALTIAPTKPVPAPTTPVEERLVELEWPGTMRYGDSDTIRLSLISLVEGYELTAEFPDHQAETERFDVNRPEGYDLVAVARLDGVGFEITPDGERQSFLPVGEGITWRWTLRPEEPGQQHLSVTLLLRWVPTAGESGQIREFLVYSKSLNVRVVSFFGLTRRTAMTGGLFGLLFGGGLSLYMLVSLIGPAGPAGRPARLLPNKELVLEAPTGLALSPQEEGLFQRLFSRYHRLVIEREFPTGYSGARTFQTLPIRLDGRADAYSVVKIDQREKIRLEYENYENYVKHTLPPITARIQQAPVYLERTGTDRSGLAALQYTFIAEPGRMPLSLRESLLKNPDPDLLWKLFETFGPSWWMQRRAYTFHLAQEYDRMLPTHYVVEPLAGSGKLLDGRVAPNVVKFEVGDRVILRNFDRVERRADGRGMTLTGKPVPGQARLRVHWQSLKDPAGAGGRIANSRWNKLREIGEGFDLGGLADPLERLPGLLDEKVSGTLSTIHGDLNLENVLVGPGDIVWLIDFATTRDGHTLYDFAHLKAELIAHILAPRIDSPGDFLALLAGDRRRGHSDLSALLEAVDGIATRCLFNPSQPREFDLALFMACIGALKFENLARYQKHLLYLTAAQIGGKL